MLNLLFAIDTAYIYWCNLQKTAIFALTNTKEKLWRVIIS
jgi:hypothetical protein